MAFPSDTRAGFELGEKIAMIEIERTKDYISTALWDGEIPDKPGLWSGKYAMLPMAGHNKTVVLENGGEFRPGPPPDFAKDETFFWGEGILVFAAKENNRRMIDLLMSYGAKVPAILKWGQFYYFERLDGASYMMEKGMGPNTMSWHHVTLLHDMAQKSDIHKAELLIKYGADLDPVDEEYRSTPLGMAARWGHMEMVDYLLSKGANVNKAGAEWSTPLAWAKKKGHHEIEKILRKSGAK